MKEVKIYKLIAKLVTVWVLTYPCQWPITRYQYLYLRGGNRLNNYWSTFLVQNASRLYEVKQKVKRMKIVRFR